MDRVARNWQTSVFRVKWKCNICRVYASLVIKLAVKSVDVENIKVRGTRLTDARGLIGNTKHLKKVSYLTITDEHKIVWIVSFTVLIKSDKNTVLIKSDKNISVKKTLTEFVKKMLFVRERLCHGTMMLCVNVDVNKNSRKVGAPYIVKPGDHNSASVYLSFPGPMILHFFVYL